MPAAHRLFKTVFAALMASFVLSAFATQAFGQEKYASIVIDAETNEVLHARFADERRYPASLTKVMTLYMLFDALKAGDIRLSDKLTISKNADRQPASDLGIRAGRTISVEDAINALVTKSANDIAVAVAERLGGTEDRFAALMTVKARSLGLAKTSFYNASGLPDPRQITTARDMAKLAEAVLDTHADYYSYFSKTRFNWNRKTFRNHNKLLNTVDGVDGIKTGYTRASGFNLMASAKRDNRRVIAIMLGGNSAKARNRHVTELINAAYTAIDAKNTGTLQAAPSDKENTPLVAFTAPAPTTTELVKLPNGSIVAKSFSKPLAPIAEGDASTAE